MKIIFDGLTLINFKNHKYLTLSFPEITRISGTNGAGKSSIGEAITWILFGTDTLGSKTDPTPTNYEFDEVIAKLLMNVDGKSVLLGRSIVKGKAGYIVNDVPVKATEFETTVESMFDKNLFLTLFNPSYFFTQKWDEQRAQILQHVTAPANVEVFKELEKPQSEKLGELFKKHGPDDLEKIHRANKTKLDKDIIAQQSRVKTLTEQLQRADGKNIDVQAVQKEIGEIEQELAGFEGKRKEAVTVNRKLSLISNRMDQIKVFISSGKENHAKAKVEPVEGACKTCGQDLQGEALEKAEQSKQADLNRQAKAINDAIKEFKQLQEESNSIGSVEETVDLQPLYNRQNELRNMLQESQAIEQSRNMVVEAKKTEEKFLESRNESIFVLDALKAFHAKAAEMQAKKVSDLFTNLSLRLFKVNKTDGEIKPDFEIMMHGKPYSKLSTAEKIKAGLELIDVLNQQSDIVVPVFVDCAESILNYTAPLGQLIEARVANHELKVEIVETKTEKLEV
jgi:DNA repair exonuclease SbcCD ATPase subunit